MSYRLEYLNSTNAHLWEDFNQKSHEGTFFHTLKWKKILESLGYVSHYIIIFKDDELIAICPFFETYIKRFKGITTLLKSDYNHVIFKDNDPDAIQYLRKELVSIAKKNSWSFIVIHSLDCNFKNNFDTHLEYISLGNMVLDIEKLNTDKIWNEVFTNKIRQRKFINRFRRDGFELEDLVSREDMKIFYDYYIKNIKFLKAEGYPYSHFRDLCNTYFPKNLNITLVHKKDVIAGGLLMFLDHSKKTMYIRYLALNRDLPNTYHTPYILYWDALEKANKLKFKKVCFGTTPKDHDNPNFRIKRNFGCNYENSYSILLPISKVFRVGYKFYTSIIQ